MKSDGRDNTPNFVQIDTKNMQGKVGSFFFVTVRQMGINGAPRVWAEKNIFGHKILMKQPHDCSY